MSKAKPTPPPTPPPSPAPLEDFPTWLTKELKNFPVSTVMTVDFMQQIMVAWKKYNK